MLKFSSYKYVMFVKSNIWKLMTKHNKNLKNGNEKR